MSGNRPLGDFLRTRRHALDPVALGLSEGRRRRTAGLRREEVAERAGISCEWYVKLEQGRDVSPSPETVAALARALTLDQVDAGHLRRLAEGQLRRFAREKVPVIVDAIVTSLPDPAYVTGARGDVLTWNAAADALFGFGAMAEPDRNILLFMLTDPIARELFGDDWSFQAKRMVALFRVAYDAHAGDPAFEDLVSRLIDASPTFISWWRSHGVALPGAGTKTLHSAGGVGASYVYASFQSNDDPAMKLALYKRCDTGTWSASSGGEIRMGLSATSSAREKKAMVNVLE